MACDSEVCRRSDTVGANRRLWAPVRSARVRERCSPTGTDEPTQNDGSGADSSQSEARVPAAADTGVDPPFAKRERTDDTSAVSDRHGDNARPSRPLPPDGMRLRQARRRRRRQNGT